MLLPLYRPVPVPVRPGYASFSNPNCACLCSSTPPPVVPVARCLFRAQINVLRLILTGAMFLIPYNIHTYTNGTHYYSYIGLLHSSYTLSALDHGVWVTQRTTSVRSQYIVSIRSICLSGNMLNYLRVITSDTFCFLHIRDVYPA